MRRVCAWCGKDLKGSDQVSAESNAPISHGICADCTPKLMSYRAKPLKSFLDRFSEPVYLIDAEGRVVTANSAGFSALGKTEVEVEGQLGGDAFNCRYAELPGGCGKTLHCKTCTIRRTVMSALDTGKSEIKVAAYPDLHHITGETKVRFLISTEKVGNGVLLRIDEISETTALPPDED